MTDARYSILPCPYGCSLSGLFPDNFVPIIVITDESTSLKLFNASKIIAIEFVTNPTVALNATSIRFTSIPKILIFIIFYLFPSFSPFYY